MTGRFFVRRLAAILLIALGMLALPAPLAAQGVLINHLSDVSFGTIANVGIDQVQSQSVCAYSGLLGGRYTVTATGSGAGGAFTLAAGSNLLPYEVQWNGSAGQSSGTNLTPGAALAGQTMLLSCPVLQATNASLIVLLRAGKLSSATAGTYTGTLTILIAPD